MREIKFRAKSKHENNWLYGIPVKFKDGTWFMIEQPADEYIEKSILGEIDPDTIGIYIGLKDKNNKEIFEGDIVKVIEEDGTEHIHFVEYKADKLEEYPGFDLYPEIDVEFNTLQFYVINRNIEVIGNIYENKELLKEVK